MTYKRKAAILSALVAVLAVIFILTLVLDPENRRSGAFAWLDPSLIVMADGIEITGRSGGASLSRKNNVWVFNDGIRELPVRQYMVDDFFALLSAKNVYPLRAASSEARERLGLTEGTASRILVRGGAGLPLLDLLIGGGDVMGREVFLRKSGGEQIYSGDDRFSLFANSLPVLWYNLRLFDDISIEAVQQAEISLPDGEFFILRRSGGGWIILGSEAPLETTRLEAWIRSVIEVQGEDFFPAAPEVIEGSITLRLGDGTAHAVQAGPSGEQDKSRIAAVSSSLLAYTLSEYSVSRLFRGSSYFIRD